MVVLVWADGSNLVLGWQSTLTLVGEGLDLSYYHDTNKISLFLDCGKY